MFLTNNIRSISIMMNPVYAFGSILLAWTLCFPNCVAEPEPIRGGNVDVKNEAIWAVSIQRVMDNEWTHACGGSLISEQDIITAAHCFVRFEANTVAGHTPNLFRNVKEEKFRIVIGLKELGFKDAVPGRGIEKKIKRVFIHKDYQKIGDFLINDIAVIRVKKPLGDEDRKINPKNKFGFIPLFRSNESCNKESFINREAFGAAYGVVNITEDQEYELDGLRKILRVHFTDKCEVPFPGLILAHYVDEAPTAHGFCRGDSGSSVYVKNGNNDTELVGVISSGPCVGDQRPSSGNTVKLTFVLKYLDFIDSIKNVDESRIKKQYSLEKYEKTGATFFVLPDHNNIAKFKYFHAPKSNESEIS